MSVCIVIVHKKQLDNQSPNIMSGYHTVWLQSYVHRKFMSSLKPFNRIGRKNSGYPMMILFDLYDKSNKRTGDSSSTV